MLRIELLCICTVFLCSCSNYPTKKRLSASVAPHSLNGTYSTIPIEQYRSYQRLTDDYGPAKIKQIYLTCLSKKLLLLHCTTAKDSVYTLLLKGRLQRDSFRVKTKRRLRWQIFSMYESDKFRFKIEQNKLTLYQKSIHLIFIIVAPIMGAEEKTYDQFERKSSH